MARLLTGKEIAATLCEPLPARVAALAQKGVTPLLAVVRIGERPDDAAYEAGIQRRCETFGVSLRRYALPRTAAQSELLDVIAQINADPSVHGCLLFRPLPSAFDEDLIRNALAPKKDVDGITDASLAGVFTASAQGFPPCTPQACMETLDHYGIDVSGKRAVVIGRSLVAGKPAAMMLLGRDATVTICHSRTKALAAVCRGADILLAAVGRAEMVDQSFLSPGQTVLDVGINVGTDGALVGDVCFRDAEPMVDALTPVPGGIGAVTNAVLLLHVLEAAERATQE